MRFWGKSVWVLPITTLKFAERRAAIEGTWGSILPHTYYSDHQDSLTIKVSEDNTYKSVVEKTINIIRILQIQDSEISKRIMRSKWLMFVDDDTFINPKNIKAVLKNLDESATYGELHDYRIQDENGNPGVLEILEKYPTLTHGFHGGAGILITPENLKRINLNLWTAPKIFHGDVAFTLLLWLSGIEMKTLLGLNWNSPSYYGDGFNPNGHITFHYMDVEAMKRTWNLFKSPKTDSKFLIDPKR